MSEEDQMMRAIAMSLGQEVSMDQRSDSPEVGTHSFPPPLPLHTHFTFPPANQPALVTCACLHAHSHTPRMLPARSAARLHTYHDMHIYGLSS